jgi:coatomer protein complex subunit alpha (xenin)
MFFAALGKEQITVFTKSLVKVTSTSEKIHIKSGCWLNSSILLYSTKAQIKYLLLNGDTGVIKSTENIMYIAAVKFCT